ncbi:hypothetical protein M3936_19470 [Sutcliffiella horikoshii]|uniref:hypothetical protein n=1 Tax=Sutcliffiella horikoshii TaxID=79883 RepID=UPI00203EB3E1|nr:hypothetical protein [Sutcliffiella horikoshii]MCM3619754.1 hypothetical protein [Sutcliffiella horikoshii]
MSESIRISNGAREMKKVWIIGCMSLFLVACALDRVQQDVSLESNGGTSETNTNAPENTENEPGTKSVEGTDKDGKQIIAYHFHEVESLPSTKSFIEAVEAIFGTDRYYYDYSEESISHFGDMVASNDRKDYRLNFDTKNGNVIRDYGLGIILDLELDPTYDPRMEMIDLIHYLKLSGLIRESSPTEENYQNDFYYTINLYNARKPGMNYEEPAVIWKLRGRTIIEMDFSNKKDILGSIHRYGKYEGMFPPVD